MISTSRTPFLLKIWVIIACGHTLGVSNSLSFLAGGRIFGYQLYFFELLIFPSFLIVVKQLLFRRSLPLLPLILFFYLSMMGVVGVLNGHFINFVYDRTRSFSAILIIAVLHIYSVRGQTLWKLLRPIILCSMAGNILTVGEGLARSEIGTNKHILEFSFLGSLFYLIRFMEKPKTYYLLALAPSFVYAFYDMARMMILSMLGAITALVTLSFRKLKSSTILGLFGGGIIFIIIYFFSPVAQDVAEKNIREGSLSAAGLEKTSEIRIAELNAIKGMSTLNWIFGKGTGATWDGSDIYQGDGDEQLRSTFHIYFGQILYNYGLVGLTLFVLLLNVPVIRNLYCFNEIDQMTTAATFFIIALQLKWFGSSSEGWIEFAAMSFAIYAATRRPEPKTSVRKSKSQITPYSQKHAGGRAKHNSILQTEKIKTPLRSDFSDFRPSSI